MLQRHAKENMLWTCDSQRSPGPSSNASAVLRPSDVYASGVSDKWCPIGNSVASFVRRNVLLLLVIKDELLIYPFPPTFQNNRASAACWVCLFSLCSRGDSSPRKGLWGEKKFRTGLEGRIKKKLKNATLWWLVEWQAFFITIRKVNCNVLTPYCSLGKFATMEQNGV